MEEKEVVTPLHLSEEDIDKIVEHMCDRLENRFYQNVGQGIISLVAKGVLLVALGLAAYGAGIHYFK